MPLAEATATPRALPSSALETSRLVADPYLHLLDDGVYHPLHDLTLRPEDAGYPAVRAVAEGRMDAADLEPGLRADLFAAGWLARAEEPDLDRRFLLKYASLEAHTLCNQACYFCPVSIQPRETYYMPTEQYRDILNQLAAYRSTLDAVFMINYNEPTADRRFVDQVRWIREAGLPPACLTNGTGLTPPRIDALVEMGGLRYLSINLSTLDPEAYQRDRGHDHLPLVLRNLDYARDRPVAEQMEVIVLGTGDDTHRAQTAAIRERFAGSRFAVKSYEVMDRAGYLEVGLKPLLPSQRLGGCNNIGSRPLQHLHITPQAKVVLCCEDYDEQLVVGDLASESIAEVLAGDRLAQYRRWAYGRDEAPADFICRNCVFALRR